MNFRNFFPWEHLIIPNKWKLVIEKSNFTYGQNNYNLLPWTYWIHYLYRQVLDVLPKTQLFIQTNWPSWFQQPHNAQNYAKQKLFRLCSFKAQNFIMAQQQQKTPSKKPSKGNEHLNDSQSVSLRLSFWPQFWHISDYLLLKL